MEVVSSELLVLLDDLIQIGGIQNVLVWGLPDPGLGCKLLIMC